MPEMFGYQIVDVNGEIYCFVSDSMTQAVSDFGDEYGTPIRSVTALGKVHVPKPE